MSTPEDKTEGPVSWFHPGLQKKIELRAQGDVIISVPPKSGTTWTMNIVYQLRSGGNPAFDDVYKEVPWPEMIERPGQPEEELLARWAALPPGRAFKSHSHPGANLQFCAKTSEKDVRYIVVVRNPEESVVSFKPFIEAHNEEHWKAFNCLEETRAKYKFGSSFKTFFEEAVLKGPDPSSEGPEGGMMTLWFYDFINSWWPLRNEENVLFLHYNDMKKDHAGSIRRIADHLGIEPTAEEWERILLYTSFEWMKEHSEKFELQSIFPYKLMVRGAMVRKGAIGKSEEDGMTPEISTKIRDLAAKLVPDESARKWLFDGGVF